MAHRDGLPRFSARSVRCGDAGHREACATPPESLGKPPFRSGRRTAGGRRKALPMSRIACGFPPTRRIACAISMGHYQEPLVLVLRFDSGRGLWHETRHVANRKVPAVNAQARGAAPLASVARRPEPEIRGIQAIPPCK